VTIKMSGHPPFGAQVILNGHEYVAAQAQKAGVRFTKEENSLLSGTRVFNSRQHPDKVRVE
jgi:hypothetical protein